MRSAVTRTIIAGLLAFVFTAFNVGLPIVMYVCPMMNGSFNTCTCHSRPDRLSITFHRDMCCSPSVLAERNTVPFLGVKEFQTPKQESILVLSSSMFTLQNFASGTQAAVILDTGPPPHSTPAYILSAALLI